MGRGLESSLNKQKNGEKMTETDALKVAAINAVKKVIGAPGEPNWPEGFTEDLKYEMRRQGLIDWLEIEFEHRGGNSSLPSEKTIQREYRLSRNAKEYMDWIV